MSLQSAIKKYWKLLDEAFFGNLDPKNIISEKNIENYYILKSALISETIELYKHLGYQPSKKLINENNNKIIKKSKMITEKVIKTKTMRKTINEMVKSNFSELNENISLDKFISEKVKESTMSIYLDNILLLPGIKNGKNVNENLQEDIRFSITRSAYNTFKNELINLVLESIKDKK